MKKNLSRYLPIVGWLRAYKPSWLKGDIVAGLTVGVMLIPQGMAYSMIAGMPPIYGLYTSIVPILLYAVLGTSRHLAFGPVAMISLLTAATVSTMAEGGSSEYFLLIITVALMVGLLQLLMGIFRLGFLVNFISHPVISGFSSAAALIIITSQLRHLLGVDINGSVHFYETYVFLFREIDQISWFTLFLGSGGIIFLIGLRKINKAIPGQLLVVILGILLMVATGWEEKGVRVLGSIPEGLPEFGLPSFDKDTWKALFPIALTISLLSFMQAIAISKTFLNKHRGEYDLDPNQELMAIGIANIGGSFFQSIPSSGSFGRTAVNDQSGATTPLSSIVSVGLIAVTLLFLTPLFYSLPKAILASIILVAVAGLIDIQGAKELWKVDRKDFWMMALTFLATLIIGIETGILVGVALSLGLVIYQSAYPHIAVLGQIPGTSYYRNINRFKHAEIKEGVLVLRIDSPLFFANAGYVKEKVTQLEAQTQPTIQLIILNAESVSSVDSTAVNMLIEMITDGRKRGRDFAIAGAIGPVRDLMFKNGLLDLLGKDHVFPHVHDAVEHLIESSQKNDTMHIAWQVGKS